MRNSRENTIWEFCFKTSSIYISTSKHCKEKKLQDYVPLSMFSELQSKHNKEYDEKEKLLEKVLICFT